MRLLLVNYEYPPLGGGAATATEAMAKSFVGMGHAVTVLTSGFGGSKGDSMECGLRVVRLATGRRRKDRASIGEMLAFVARAMVTAPALAEEASVEAAIVFFSIPCGPIGLLLKLRRRIPYVLSLRGGDVPGFLPQLDRMHFLARPVRRLCLRSACAVAANSPSLAALATAADGGRVAVIPNGVDTEAFAPGDESPHEAYEFIFVGRLTEQKRLGVLMDAFDRLHRAKRNSPITLSIVGDGPLADELKRKAALSGIAAAVTWHGWVDREALRHLYGRADCLVQASNIEGMSNTLLEGMACALPVIASDAPGNRDVMSDRVNGLLFAVDDADGLYAAMRELVEDRELSARLGRASREIAVSRYSWRSCAEAYLNLLKDTGGFA